MLTSRYWLIFLLVGSALGGALFLDSPTWAGDRFVQDRFVISFWVDPPFDANAEQRYREIAEAHFTMVLGGFGASPEAVTQLLKLCEKYNLKALVPTFNKPASEFPDGPACWGYGVQDEPTAKDFPALKQKVDEIRKARPGKLAYINLFPNYVDVQRIETSSYEEYVSRFIKEVGVDVLSMDYYPQFRPDADGRDGYCGNLEVMRKYSQEADIPFWNFFNSMPFGTQTDPTEAQLRWQIYSSLAYGAKGVLYFCYYTPVSPEFPKGGAIIARNDKPTRHYDQAKRINFELKNLGDTLMKLTSTSVLRVKPDDQVKEVLAGSPIRNLSGADDDPKPDYLIGVFRHQDGRRAVLLNNYHFAYTAWPTVEFDAEAEKVLEVSKVDGQPQPVADDSPEIEGIQISLDAGEGRLFLLP
jgi:hypothetical protein